VGKIETAENKNQHITKELERLLNIYESENDRGRLLGYRRAINLIKIHPTKIEDAKELVNIKGIGEKIRDKVCEILRTGTLKRAIFLEQDEKILIKQQFMKIYGVGPSVANKLYNNGFRSIDDVRKNPGILSQNQLIGLKCYEESNDKNDRKRLIKIVDNVRTVCLMYANKGLLGVR